MADASQRPDGEEPPVPQERLGLRGPREAPGSTGAGNTRPDDRQTVALVGQPNVGKSLIFSRLTGKYVSCSNYPGTTVELYHGEARIGDRDCRVLDTPGMLDLASSREDERVTRDLLLFDGVDVVVQVADAKSLDRALSLFVQLAELGLPLVLNLNMADERRDRGIPRAVERLAGMLGVPVVETVATTGEGMDDLREAILVARRGTLAVRYDEEVDKFLGELVRLLPPGTNSRPDTLDGSVAHESPKHVGRRPGEPLSSIDRRALAALLLALPARRARPILERMEIPPSRMAAIRAFIDSLRNRDPRLSYRLALSRRDTAEEVLERVPAAPSISEPTGEVETETEAAPAASRRLRANGQVWADRLGRWTVHPVGGLLILAAVLYGIYQFVGVLGAQILVDWLEGTLFGEWLLPMTVATVERLVPTEFLQEMLVGEFGLITMAITYAVALILPIVTTFFLAFGFLEDSGYFPRLTVVAHRAFRKMGLSGQAVLPMILGLSCDTMATVTTRVLETKKERIIATLLLALGVPCSAQLAVLLAMSAAVSPWVLTGVMAIVGLQLLIVGRMASLVLPGRSTPFVMELPPLRWPDWRNILAKTRLRLVWYVTEVLPLFVIGTFALFVLDRTGLLSAIQRGARPLVEGVLELPGEASSAFVMGFFRRDYGAAGLYHLQTAGGLDTIQLLVSLVVITLFVPCIANLLVIIKERGWKTATAMVAFILPYSFLVGWGVNVVARRVASTPVATALGSLAELVAAAPGALTALLGG